MLESALRYLGAYKVYEGRLKAQVKEEEIPGHIGIILDGNRRWALIAIQWPAIRCSSIRRVGIMM